MTTSTPASPLAEPAGGAVIRASDNDPRRRLLLEMAPKTKIGVARHQHLLVHRPVWIVTRRAALPDSFVLENKRPALCRMALAARVPLGEQGGSAAPNCRAFVRIMAIAAAHFPVQHRMAMRQLELPLFVQVTLEAGFR